MKIAYLTNILTNANSPGGSIHVSQIAKKLIERGHILYTNLQNESDIFVKFTEKDFFSRGEEIEIFYIRIDGWARRDELTLLRKSNLFAPCVWEVNAPIEELKTYGISGAKLDKLKRRRKKLAKMVDMAICVSDEMGEYAREELDIKNVYIIPNGSDPTFFNPEKRDESMYEKTKYKILWSGSSKYKWQGIEIVKKIAKVLREKGIDDIAVVVTAEGESSGNLLFVGQIPYSEISRYVASVDIGLCIYENIDFYKNFYFSPLKLYDYMASSLPVIGTNFGQIKHVIETYKCGLLTDNTVEDLIEKIMFLKNNPEIASEMGRRGRKAVVEKYNWDNVALQTESILLETIERHKMLLNSKPKWWLAINNFNCKIIAPLYNSSKHRLYEVRNRISEFAKLSL